MTAVPVREAAARLVAFYEGLGASDVERMAEFHAADACFRDPFNEVTGLADIHRVFAHMFETVTNPRFEIVHTMTRGDEAWLTWRFLIDRPRGTLTVRGATQLSFARDGRISRHRDYWDTGEELYAKLPLIGVVVRWLTRKLSATA